MIRQLLDYLQSYVGECMIYTIIDWLNENANKIINNPGPLVKEKVSKTKIVTSNSDIKSKRKASDKVSFITAKDIENVKQSYTSRTSSSEYKDMITQRQNFQHLLKKHWFRLSTRIK